MLNTLQLKKAQRDFRKFVAFNVVSFSFLTGNILILYSIRLGAGTRLIGFLSALASITFIFSLFGRRIIRYLGIVKTRGYFWLFRYLIMIPVMITVVPSVRNNEILSLTIITTGYFLFNLFKGIALAAAKPILGYISRDSDRAHFVAGNNMITFTGQIVTGIIMALALGAQSPLYMYVVFIALGITAGIFASAYALKLPEPVLDSPMKQVSLFSSFKSALSRPEFSTLLLLVVFANIAIGMAMGFVVVYAKTVYRQPDSLVVVFTVAGALGAMAMAGISRFMTDRVGSKPMYFLFTGLRIVVLIPLIVAPSFSTALSSFVFLLIIFFLNQMTIWGVQSTADLYFFATTNPEDRIDLGIVFNLARGISGMVGSLGGGFMLDWLQKSAGAEQMVLPFQIHFTVSIIFLVLNLLIINRLPDVSDYSITDLLSIIFSPRDLRAINFLNRLEKSNTTEEEEQIVTAMSDSRSLLSMNELRRRMNSPGVFIRMSAISGLRKYPADRDTIKLLLKDVEMHPYTSAHVSAGFIGEVISSVDDVDSKLRKQVIETMFKALESEDYLLKSKAALVLGQMGVQEAVGTILGHLKSAGNPREIIYCVKALEYLGAVKALPVIYEKIGTENYPHLTDDLTISAAALLGMGDWFYPYYQEFLKNRSVGVKKLINELIDKKMRETALEINQAKSNEQAVERFCSMIEEHHILDLDNNRTAGDLIRFLRLRPGLMTNKLRFLCTSYAVHMQGNPGV